MPINLTNQPAPTTVEQGHQYKLNRQRLRDCEEVIYEVQHEIPRLRQRDQDGTDLNREEGTVVVVDDYSNTGYWDDEGTKRMDGFALKFEPKSEDFKAVDSLQLKLSVSTKTHEGGQFEFRYAKGGQGPEDYIFADKHGNHVHFTRNDKTVILQDDTSQKWEGGHYRMHAHVSGSFDTSPPGFEEWRQANFPEG